MHRDRQAPPLSLDSILSIVDSPFDYRKYFVLFLFLIIDPVPTIQFDTALSRGDIDLLIGVRKSPQMHIKLRQC